MEYKQRKMTKLQIEKRRTLRPCARCAAKFRGYGRQYLCDKCRTAHKNSPSQKQKLDAVKLVSRAIKSGKLIRSLICETCGKPPTGPWKIHGHHDDYSKPLDVRWLCTWCHHDHHTAERDKVRMLKAIPFLAITSNTSQGCSS